MVRSHRCSRADDPLFHPPVQQVRSVPANDLSAISIPLRAFELWCVYNTTAGSVNSCCHLTLLLTIATRALPQKFVAVTYCTCIHNASLVVSWAYRYNHIFAAWKEFLETATRKTPYCLAMPCVQQCKTCSGLPQQSDRSVSTQQPSLRQQYAAEVEQWQAREAALIHKVRCTSTRLDFMCTQLVFMSRAFTARICNVCPSPQHATDCCATSCFESTLPQRWSNGAVVKLQDIWLSLSRAVGRADIFEDVSNDAFVRDGPQTGVQALRESKTVVVSI